MCKICVFLLISFTALGQVPIGVDSLMLGEKVKTKTQYVCDSKGEDCKPEVVWHYDQNGLLTLKQTYKNGVLAETNRYVYNIHNLAEKVFTTVGTTGAEFLNIKYSYDAKKNMVSFDACYAGGKCEPFEKYVYRADNKLASRTRFKEGRYFYEYKHRYDVKGNNIEILILSKDSDSGEKEKKTYDSKGLHIRSKWIDYRGDEIDNAEYTYNAAGRLIKNEWVGGLSTQKLYKYDEQGNNTEYKSIDYTGQIDDLRTMTFDGKLITSRVQTDGKTTTGYWVFGYEKY